VEPFRDEPEIENAIRASGDAEAIHWLERTKSGRRSWSVDHPAQRS
jgi:hypothetical protein